MVHQREQFETAVLRSAYALLAEPEQLLARGNDDDYKFSVIQAAWWGWQVSKAGDVRYAESGIDVDSEVDVDSL